MDYPVEAFEYTHPENAVTNYRPGDGNRRESYGILMEKVKPNTIHGCDEDNCIFIDNLGGVNHVRKSLKDAIELGVF